MTDDRVKRSEALLYLFYVARDKAALMQVSSDPDMPEGIRAYASGLLMRDWLPWDKTRKAIMLLIAVAAISCSVWLRNVYVLLWLLALLFMSPRFVAEVAQAIARSRRL